ncbi:uncharacterized protein LOC122803858 [Protopterus annectens]|uniref:uncharacterized protein LOC122803858 n=1 Tax=Protopterus annectens TaxID=7888 RepID=UPI001CF9509B|nr:uncharacterized protein LOC122803858 [Protopterus annectens]
METNQFTYYNENTEQIERPAKRRRSSILKVPRSPLKEVNGGNCTEQDITERRRKSSRRVSFADTKQIKVFSRDVHNENGEVETSAENDGNTGNQSLVNRETSTNNAKCQISGMEILLRAPIQAPLQQTEWGRHTDVFAPDEKENFDSTFSINCTLKRPSDKADDTNTEQTAFEQNCSHKGSIGLKPLTSLSYTCSDNGSSCQEESMASASSQKVCSEQSFRNFLASLNISGQEIKSTDKRKTVDHSAVSEPKQTFNYQCNTENSAVKKIDFKNFLAGLNSRRQSTVGSEMMEKENIFPLERTEFFSKSESTERHPFSERVFGFSKDTTGDITKVFKEQDGEMELTQCHTSSVNAFLPTARDAPQGQFGRGDVTLLCSDVMDITLNQAENNQNSKAMPTSKMKNGPEAVGNGISSLRILTNPCYLEGIASNGQSLYRISSKDKTLGEEDVEINTTSITKIFKDNDAEMEITQCHTANIDELSETDGKENKCRYGDNTVLCGDNMDMTFNCADIVSFSKTNTCKATSLDYSLTVKSANYSAISDVGKSINSHPINLTVDSKQSCSSGTFSEKKNLGEEDAGITTDDLTKVFKGQDGDMEMTQCHTNKVSTHLSTVDVQQKPLSRGEVTMLCGDVMDITLNRTEDVSLSKISLSGTSVTEICKDAAGKKATGRTQTNAVQFEVNSAESNLFSAKLSESSNAYKGMGITNNHSIVIDNGIKEKIGNQGKAILICQKLPLSVLSEQKDKTAVLRNEKEDVDFNLCHASAIKIKPKEACEVSAAQLQNFLEPASSPQEDTHSLSVKYGFKRQDALLRGNKTDDHNDLDAACSFAGIHCDTSMEQMHKTGIPIASSLESDFAMNMCHSSFFKERTFLGCDDMDLTRSHTVTVDARKLELDSAKGLNDGGKMEQIASCSRGSVLPCDNTIVFPAGERDDMEITKSHTVPIDSDMILGSSSTDLTRRKSATIDTRVTGLNSDIGLMNAGKVGQITPLSRNVSLQCNDTIVSPNNNEDDMEITNCPLKAIDCQTSGHRLKSLDKSKDLLISFSLSPVDKMFLLPGERSVFLDENTVPSGSRNTSQYHFVKEMHRTSESNATLPSSDKTEALTEAESDMEFSRSHVMFGGKRVNEVALGENNVEDMKENITLKGNYSSSMYYNQDNLNVTKSCINKANNDSNWTSKGYISMIPSAVDVNNAEDKSCSHPAEKTVIFKDDMEVTKSHTTVLEIVNTEFISAEGMNDVVKLGKSFAPSRRSLSVIDKTIIFPLDNPDDMEITKSLTVTIDNQTCSQDVKNLKGPKNSTISSESIDCASFSETKENSTFTGMVTVNTDLNVTLCSRQTASQCDKGLNSVKTLVNKSLLPIGTVSSIENQDNIEVTMSHAAAIDRKSNTIFSEKQIQSDIAINNLPLKGIDKSVYSDDQEAMDVTRNHMVLINGSFMDQSIKEKASIFFSESEAFDATVNCSHNPKVKSTVFLEDDVVGATKSHSAAIGNINHNISDEDLMDSVETGTCAAVPLTKKFAPLYEKTKFQAKYDVEINKSQTVPTDSGTLNQKFKHFSESRKNILECVPHDSNEREVLFAEDEIKSGIAVSSDIATCINVVPATRLREFQSPEKRGSNTVVSVNKNMSSIEDQYDMEMTSTLTAMIDIVDTNADTRPKQVLLNVKEHDLLLKDNEQSLVYADDPEAIVSSISYAGTVSGSFMESNRNGDISTFPYTKGAEKITDMGQVSHLEMKSMVFSGDDMDITRSHTTAIDHINLNASGEGAKDTINTEQCSPLRMPSLLNDKSIIFASDLQDMEITKCHSVPIESLSIKFSDLNESRKDLTASVNSNSKRQILAEDKKANCAITMDFNANPCLGQRVIQGSSFTAENCIISEDSEIKLFSDKISSTKDQDEMEMTRSHTVAIDFRESDTCLSPKQVKLVINNNLPSKEKKNSVASSDTDITNCPAVVVSSKFVHLNEKETQSMHSSEVESCKLTVSTFASAEETGVILSDYIDISNNQIAASEKENILMLPSEKESNSVANVSTFSCAMEERDVSSDDMDITKSQTTTINHVDSRLVLGSSTEDVVKMETHVSLPRTSVSLLDKAIYFTQDHQDDMEINKCCILPSNRLNVGQEFKCLSESVKSLSVSVNVDPVGRTSSITSKPNKMLLSADKCLYQDDMEIPKSHTVAFVVKDIDTISNKKQTGLHIKENDYVLNANNTFACYSNKEAPQRKGSHDHIVMSQNYKERFSMPLCNITDVDLSYSEEKNVSTRHDREEVKRPTVAMDDTNFGVATDEGSKCTGGTEKCASSFHESVLLGEKSVIYSTGQQGSMEMTESVTVAIDSKTLNQGFDTSGAPQKNKGSFCPIDRTVLFQEGENMDMTTYSNGVIDTDFVSSPSHSLHQHYAIRSSVQFDSDKSLSEKAVVCTLEDHGGMEMTLNHTGSTVLPFLEKLNDVVNSGSLSAHGEKTVLLGDDMDTTKSHTVIIDHSFTGGGAKNVLSGRVCDPILRKSNLLGDKSIIFQDQDSMEITGSHKADFGQASLSSEFKDLNMSKKHCLASVSTGHDNRIASHYIEENSDPTPTSNIKVGLGTLPSSSQSVLGTDSFSAENLVSTLSAKQLYSSKEQCELEVTKIIAAVDCIKDNRLLSQKETLCSVNESSLTVKESEHSQTYINNLGTPYIRNILTDVTQDKLLEMTDREASTGISSGSTNKYNLSSEEKTVALVEDMDTTKSHTAVLEDLQYGFVLSKETKTKSSEGTVIFPTDSQDDMEITRSHTLTIERPMLGQEIKNAGKLRKRTSALLYEDFVDRNTLCQEDEENMDLTRCTDSIADMVPSASQCMTQHLVKTLNKMPDEKALFPADKTIIFESEEQDKMELTVSHTAAIEFKNAERALSQSQAWADLKENKLLSAEHVISNTNVDFAKSDSDVNSGSLTNHSCVERVYTVPSREESHNAVEVETLYCGDSDTVKFTRNKNITKSHCAVSEDLNQDIVSREDVAKLGQYNSITRKSIIPCDKTILFPADTQGDIEVTTSHTTAADTQFVCQSIERVSMSKKSILGSVSVSTDRTVLFPDDEGNMDLTNCATVGITGKSVESTAQNKSQSSITEKLSSNICASNKSLLAIDRSVAYTTEEKNVIEMTRSISEAINIMLPDIKENAIPPEGRKAVDHFDFHNAEYLTENHACVSRYKLRDVTFKEGISLISGESKNIATLDILSNLEEKPCVTSEKYNSVMSENHSAATVVRNCGLTVSHDSKDTGEVKSSLHCKASSLPSDTALIFSIEKGDMELTETCIHVDSPACHQKNGHLSKPSKSVSSFGCRFPVDETVVFQEDMDQNRNAISFGSMNASHATIPLTSECAEKTFCAFALENKVSCVSTTSEKNILCPVDENYMEETKKHTVTVSCEVPERTVYPNQNTSNIKTRIFCSNNLKAAASTSRTVDKSLSDMSIAQSNADVPEATNALCTEKKKSAHVTDLLYNQSYVVLSDKDLSTAKKDSGLFVLESVLRNDALEQPFDDFSGSKGIADNGAMDITVNPMSSLKLAYINQELATPFRENTVVSINAEMEIPESPAVTTGSAAVNTMDYDNHAAVDMSVGFTFPASGNCMETPMTEATEEMEVNKACSLSPTNFSFTSSELQSDIPLGRICHDKITAAEEQFLPLFQDDGAASGSCTLEKQNMKSSKLPGNKVRSVDSQSCLSTAESHGNDELYSSQNATGSTKISPGLCCESIHVSSLISQTKTECVSECTAVSEQNVRCSELRKSETVGLPSKHTSLVECSGLQNCTEHNSPSFPSKKLTKMNYLPEYMINYSSEAPQKSHTSVKITSVDLQNETVSEFAVQKQCSYTGQFNENNGCTVAVLTCDSSSAQRYVPKLPHNTQIKDEQHSNGTERMKNDCISSCTKVISTESTSATIEQCKTDLETQAGKCNIFPSHLKATLSSSKPQIKRLPLGVFLPKLPEKKKCVDAAVLESSLTKTVDPRLSQGTFSSCRPSAAESIFKSKELQESELMQYITEEIPPDCAEDMDSMSGVDYEISEGSCEKQTVDILLQEMKKANEDKNATIKQNKKRQRSEDYEEDLNVEKKCRFVKNCKDASTTQMQASCLTDVLWESTSKSATGDALTCGMKKGADISTSSGNSSDSTKGEGTFTDFSNQRCCQMESQLLQVTSNESHLRAKVWDGTITVKEFFKLLHVSILIQKPRQSLLPARCTSKPLTAEAQLLDKLIYHHVLHIYQENSKTLSQTSEQLKLRLKDMDKYLVDVNKSLWENIKMSSDEQVKCLQSDLMKMRSYFTKKSKLIVQEGKVELYSKLSEMMQVVRMFISPWK